MRPKTVGYYGRTNIAYNTSLKNQVVFMWDNIYTVPNYKPGVSVVPQLQGLINVLLVCGGITFMSESYKGKTFGMVNIDNLTTTIFQSIKDLSPYIEKVDWFENYNLHCKTTTGVQVKVENFDLNFNYNNLEWDKHFEKVDNKTVIDELTTTELSTTISEIENITGDDIIVSGTGTNGSVIKQDKVNALYNYFGIVGE